MVSGFLRKTGAAGKYEPSFVHLQKTEISYDMELTYIDRDLRGRDMYLTNEIA